MLKSINSQNDVVISELTTTNGFFGTSGTGTIQSQSLTTSSLSSTQKEYYYNLQFNSTDHFTVAYGHIAGSGSDANASNEVGTTEAIYKGFYGLVEAKADKIKDSQGFLIADGTNGTTPVTQSDCYFIVAERLQMKDRINPGTWTIGLSGSNKAGAGKTLFLTDNSVTNDPEADGSAFGPRYSIRSGSAGSLKASDTREYGKFYPDAGLIVLSANALSSSLPGTKDFQQIADSGGYLHSNAAKGIGLVPDTGSEDNNPDNAGKLAMCIISGSQTMRSEENQYIYDYFCRARANEFNLSENVTFWSGSNYAMRHNDMVANPQTFISEVGVYDGEGQLMAGGRISSPLNKNFSSEAVVKVRLTY